MKTKTYLFIIIATTLAIMTCSCDKSHLSTGNANLYSGGTTPKASSDQENKTDESNFITVNILAQMDIPSENFIFTSDRTMPCDVNFKVNYIDAGRELTTYVMIKKGETTGYLPCTRGEREIKDDPRSPIIYFTITRFRPYKVDGKTTPLYYKDSQGRTFYFTCLLEPEDEGENEEN